MTDLMADSGAVDHGLSDDLNRIGINTFDDLAKIDVNELAERLEVSKETLLNLKRIARLVSLAGVDPLSARALVEFAQINTIGDLASQQPEELLGVLQEASRKGFDLPAAVLRTTQTIRGWIANATDQHCGSSPPGNDWDYLQYLIEFSKETAPQLEARFSQRFTITQDEALQEQLQGGIRYRKICLEVLRKAPGSLNDPPPDFQEGLLLDSIKEELRQIGGFPDDAPEAELAELAASFWNSRYINVLSSCDYTITRVKQCILTLQAHLREHPNLHHYQFEAEDADQMIHELGAVVDDIGASGNEAVSQNQNQNSGLVFRGPGLNLKREIEQDIANHEILTIDIQCGIQLKTDAASPDVALCTLRVRNRWGSVFLEIPVTGSGNSNVYENTSNDQRYSVPNVSGSDVSDFTKVDFEVEWHGTASIWVDHVTIDCVYQTLLDVTNTDGTREFKRSYDIAGPGFTIFRGRSDTDDDATDGRAWFVGIDSNPKGHLVRGPKQWRTDSGSPPIARALVDVRLKTESNEDFPFPDSELAQLRVYDPTLDQEVARREISRRDLPTAQKAQAYWHSPLEFLSEGKPYQFAAYAVGVDGIFVDQFRAWFHFLYRHEWEMVVGRKHFPENFYAFKQSLVRGNKTELLNGITLDYQAADTPSAVNDAVEVLRSALQADQTISKTHEAFFAEEYGLAIRMYQDAEAKIRHFFAAYAKREQTDSQVSWGSVDYVVGPRSLEDLTLEGPTLADGSGVSDAEHLVSTFLPFTRFPVGGNNDDPSDTVPALLQRANLDGRRGENNLQFLENNLAIDVDLYAVFDRASSATAQFSHPDADQLRALLRSFGILNVHYYFFVLPISIADCLSALGRYEAADRYYRLVLDTDNSPVYPWLNTNIEIPFVQIRAGRNLLAWADSLFRKQDDESKARAMQLYRSVLETLYESPDFCQRNIYDAQTKVLQQANGRVRDVVHLLQSEKARAQSRNQYTSRLKELETDLSQREQASKSLERWMPAETSGQIRSVGRRPFRQPSALDNGSATASLKMARPPKRPSKRQQSQLQCHHENPEILRQKETACLRARMIDQCMNIFGYTEDYLSIYRYDYLIGLAKSLANTALAVEKDLLQYLSKFEDESLAQLNAELAVKTDDHSIEIETTRRDVSTLQLEQAGIAVDKLNGQLVFTEWKAARTGDSFDRWAVTQTALAQLIGGAGVSAAKGGLSASPTGLISGALQAEVTLKKGLKDLETARREMESNVDALKSDIGMAQIAIDVAQQQYVIADQLRDIAMLKLEYDLAIFEFQNYKFLNKELWAQLASAVKANYALFIDYANVIAWMAERTLEFERSEDINVIRFDYFSTERQGLLAADNLIRDLEILDQHRVLSEKKRNPLKQIVSLAAEYPLQFFEFQETGELSFRTTLDMFEQNYPGMYQARIKNIEVVVQGLIGPEGIHARLTNLGVSRVRVSNGTNGAVSQVKDLIHPGDTFLLSSYTKRGDEVLFQPTTVGKELNLFEGVGVGTQWVLEMHKDANPIDFDTIVDIKLIVYFTALHSEQLRISGEMNSPKVLRGIRPFSFKHHFPDTFYQLLNSGNTSQQRDLSIATFQTRTADFPRNENNRRIRDLHLFVKTKDGAPSALAVTLTSMANSNAVRAIVDDASAENVFGHMFKQWSGATVEQKWSLKLLPERNHRDMLYGDAADGFDWIDRNELRLPLESDNNGFIRCSGTVGAAPPHEFSLPAADNVESLRIQFRARFGNDYGRLFLRFRRSSDVAAERSCWIMRHQVSSVSSAGWSASTAPASPDHDWYDVDVVSISQRNGSTGTTRLQVWIDGVSRFDTLFENEFVSDQLSIGVVEASGAPHGEVYYVDIDDIVVDRVSTNGASIGNLMTEHFWIDRPPWNASSLPDGWTLRATPDLTPQTMPLELQTMNHPRADYSAIDDILFAIEYEYTPARVLLYEPIEHADVADYDYLGWKPNSQREVERINRSYVLKLTDTSQWIYREHGNVPNWTEYRFAIRARILSGSLTLACRSGSFGSVRGRLQSKDPTNPDAPYVFIFRIDGDHTNIPVSVSLSNIDLKNEHEFDLEVAKGRSLFRIDSNVIFDSSHYVPSAALNLPRFGTVELVASDAAELRLSEIFVEKVV